MASGYVNDRHTQNLLAPNQCLVYIEMRQPFADADGSTHIAQKVRDYIQDDILWYDLILNTDADGDITLNNGTNAITVSGDKIVSDRAYHDISPRQLYHFAPLTLSSSVQYPITARGFVLKSNLIRPLEATSRSALGSGIYGLYVSDPSTISSLITDPNQLVYIVDCPKAYPLQDAEHGDSLTIASLNTNRYLDRILESLRGDESVDFESVRELIQRNENLNLTTLWNIVLYRTEDAITASNLGDVLARYVVDYLTRSDLIDSVNAEPIHELPINYILRSLGYDGIIASDMHNNGWNRGCVSYDYSAAEIIRGQLARY